MAACEGGGPPIRAAVTIQAPHWTLIPAARESEQSVRAATGGVRCTGRGAARTDKQRHRRAHGDIDEVIGGYRAPLDTRHRFPFLHALKTSAAEQAQGAAGARCIGCYRHRAAWHVRLGLRTSS